MIFIDSNAFIALWNTDHPLHQKASEISKLIAESNERLITSNIVLAEVYTILSMQVNKIVALKFGSEFPKLNIPVVFISDMYHQTAYEIFKKIKSKNVSFFDCTSFAIMEEMGIKKVFSFDNHFTKYGFEKL